MPFATRDGVRLYWRLEGAGGRPPLVLLNSIGTDMTLWDAVVPQLLPHFRLLRLDMRGHGASDAPAGDYDMSMLASDVAAVMSDAGVAHAAVAGVSLGGMVAMELALGRPDLVSALVLICTSAAMDRESWAQRIDTVRREGTAAIADGALGRFLSPAFVVNHPEIAEGLKRGIATQSDAGYAGAGASIRDMALINRLPGVAAPVMVVTGSADISTPFAGHGEHLLARIPGARHHMLESAHLPPIETPAALAGLLISFLAGSGDAERAADWLFEEGLVHRRRVLGDDWVDRALAARTPFNADFQAMITRTAWAEIWGRPGLDDRTRRLLVIAITASLGRWGEFALHVRAGLCRNGFTRDELKEVLMQLAVYAGVPAANHAFAEAGAIIAELDETS